MTMPQSLPVTADNAFPTARSGSESGAETTGFRIDSGLHAIWPRLSLGMIFAEVRPGPGSEALTAACDACCVRIKNELILPEIGSVPEVLAIREAYKACGKSPSKYRGSNEALLRRILENKGLYKVSSVVDVNNLLSLETRHSVGSYDLGNLDGAVTLRLGRESESYQGIGKGEINLHNLPVFCDAVGPFGSPTSDSERAKITSDTRRIAMVIISFTGAEALPAQVALGAGWIRDYAGGERISTLIVT